MKAHAIQNRFKEIDDLLLNCTPPNRDNIYEVNWQIIQEQTKSNPYQDGFAHARIPKRG